MKLKILNIFIGLFISSCATTVQNYEGFIYNTKREPIANIKICEQHKNNCTQTDMKGFFILKRDKNSINNLIVFHNNVHVDTIKTVWRQHGEKVNYSFIEGTKDTLFIDIK